MARKSVDVDQELDDNTADGEFESERGGFKGSNRRSAPGMKGSACFNIHRDHRHG